MTQKPLLSQKDDNYNDVVAKKNIVKTDCFVGLIVLYFSKFLSNLIYSALFDYQDERYQMNLYKFIFLTVSAVFLLPFLIFAQFTGYFSLIYIFIPIFIVFFVFFLYRLIILNPRKMEFFLLFFYNCDSHLNHSN